MASLADAHDDIQTMLDAWRAARGDALVPLKRDFDPMHIPRLLPSIWIYRFEPAVDDFVCLLAGEQINSAWGTGMRGRHFRDIVGPDNHPRALARWKAVIETPHIQYGRMPDPVMPDSEPDAERLVLPLASAPGRIDHTIGLSLYRVSQSDRQRTPPVWDDVYTIPCAEL